MSVTVSPPRPQPKLRATRGWSVPIRLAYRDARRHRARSLLAALMIGTPVLLASALATILATADVSFSERTPATFGSGDVTVSPVVSALQPAGSLAETGSTGVTRDEIATIVGDAPRLDVVTGSIFAALGNEQVLSRIVVTEPASPIAVGLFDLLDGSLPERPGEVAASPGLLDRLGARIGDELAVDNRNLRIVGVATTAYADRTRPWLLAEASTNTLVASENLVDAATTTIIDLPVPATGRELGALTEVGGPTVTVLSRADFESVRRDPLFGQGPSPAAAGTALTLIIIQLALLAGPAFAVSVRQQQLSLAQLSANGADARALRRTVLAQALALGAVAVLIGATAGIGLAVLVTALGRNLWPGGLGPLEVRLDAVLAAAVIGVVSALVAAWAPAWTAGQTSVVGALGASRGSTGYPWRRALVGVLAFAAGSKLLDFLTSTSGQVFYASIGVLTLTVGVLLVVPLAVALLLPVGRVLPPVFRLATRDAARAASRSVAAIGAVAAAAGGLIAVATFSTSIAAFEKSTYVSDLPVGTAIAFAQSGPSGASVDTLTTAVQQVVPNSPTREVSRAADAVYTLIPEGCAEECDPLFVESPAVTSGPLATISEPARDLAPLLADNGLVIPSNYFQDIDRFDKGKATLTATTQSPTGGETVQSATVTLHLVRGGLTIGSDIAVSPTTADSLLGAVPDRIIVGDDEGVGRLSNDQLIQLAGAVEQFGGRTVVGRAYEAETQWTYLIIMAAAIVAVVAGTLAATALTLTDARRERAIVAVVGARPLTNRLTAGATALVIAVVGGVLGTVLGLVPGIFASRTQTDFFSANSYGVSGYVEPTIAVPWSTIAMVLIGLPLLLALVVTLVSPGPKALEGARRHGAPLGSGS